MDVSYYLEWKNHIIIGQSLWQDPGWARKFMTSPSPWLGKKSNFWKPSGRANSSISCKLFCWKQNSELWKYWHNDGNFYGPKIKFIVLVKKIFSQNSTNHGKSNFWVFQLLKHYENGIFHLLHRLKDLESVPGAPEPIILFWPKTLSCSSDLSYCRGAVLSSLAHTNSEASDLLGTLLQCIMRGGYGYYL